MYGGVSYPRQSTISMLMLWWWCWYSVGDGGIYRSQHSVYDLALCCVGGVGGVGGGCISLPYDVLVVLVVLEGVYISAL